MPTNKYSIQNFLVPEVVDGVKIYDLVANSINDFVFPTPMRQYVVVEADLKRPDLIMINIYQNLDLMWAYWILLFINDINDIWEDISVGKILYYPSEKSINDFLVFARNNQK